MINAGERLIINNCTFGYLSHRIVFYLLNLHIKSRHTYFVSVGSSLVMRFALWLIVLLRLEPRVRRTTTRQTRGCLPKALNMHGR